MNKTTYTDLARSVFHAMNTRDFATLEMNVTEDVVFDFPGAGKIEGNRRVMLFLKALLRKYPILAFEVSEILIDNQNACAVWTNRGENSEGIAYANSGLTLMQFTGNKIAYISDYFKDTSFVQPDK